MNFNISGKRISLGISYSRPLAILFPFGNSFNILILKAEFNLLILICPSKGNLKCSIVK